MGAGCCGGYSGTGYAPMEPKLDYTDPRKYQQGIIDRRLDLGHHAIDALAHLHDFYRPKAQMPYTRPEDGHAAARLNDTAEAKLTPPSVKYRDARILYSNVSGI